MNQMRKKLAVSSPFNSQRQKLYPFIVLGTSVQHEIFFLWDIFQCWRKSSEWICPNKVLVCQWDGGGEARSQNTLALRSQIMTGICLPSTGQDSGSNLESCLACCGILETFQKYSRSILEIFENYWEFVRKNAESCVVCFATRSSKEEYQRLLWRGDRTLLHFNINIEQEAFQLEVGMYCAFTFRFQNWTRGQEATQEFENAHSLWS